MTKPDGAAVFREAVAKLYDTMADRLRDAARETMPFDGDPYADGVRDGFTILAQTFAEIATEIRTTDGDVPVLGHKLRIVP